MGSQFFRTFGGFFAHGFGFRLTHFNSSFLGFNPFMKVFGNVTRNPFLTGSLDIEKIHFRTFESSFFIGLENEKYRF